VSARRVTSRTTGGGGWKGAGRECGKRTEVGRRVDVGVLSGWQRSRRGEQAGVQCVSGRGAQRSDRRAGPGGRKKGTEPGRSTTGSSRSRRRWSPSGPPRSSAGPSQACTCSRERRGEREEVSQSPPLLRHVQSFGRGLRAGHPAVPLADEDRRPTALPSERTKKAGRKRGTRGPSSSACFPIADRSGPSHSHRREEGRNACRRAAAAARGPRGGRGGGVKKGRKIRRDARTHASPKPDRETGSAGGGGGGREGGGREGGGRGETDVAVYWAEVGLAVRRRPAAAAAVRRLSLRAAMTNERASEWLGV